MVFPSSKPAPKCETFGREILRSSETSIDIILDNTFSFMYNRASKGQDFCTYA